MITVPIFLHRSARALAMALMLQAVQAAADPLPSEAPAAVAAEMEKLAQHYPSGSISSVEIADRALAEARAAELLVRQQFGEHERQCYDRFFVNWCRDNARKWRRQALAEIDRVENEANAFKRRNRFLQREQRITERQNKQKDKPESGAQPGNSGK